MLTGWGARAFTPAVLNAMPHLKIVAHTAGTPRPLFDDATVREVLVPRGIVVYSGAGGMAHNVAEASIGLIILASRRWAAHAASYRSAGQVSVQRCSVAVRDAQFLTGATVGIVSASQVTRCLLPLLHAFGCSVLIYDPFLSAEAARDLGAEKAELEDLFARADIVSLHAPDLPATRGLISAEMLAKMRDGACLINTSRGRVLDHEALWRECHSGRLCLYAALDVSDPEPLPPGHPLWDCENVFLLPHIAGHGRAGYHRIGQGALQALRDAIAGRPAEEIKGAVPLQRWETVA